MSSEERLMKEDAIQDFSLQEEMSSELMRTIRATVNCLNQKYRSDIYDSHDFSQEIWIRLVSNNGQLLKQYDSKRGKSLTSYIKMITEREMLNILRKEHAEKRGRHITIDFDDNGKDLPYPVALDTTLEARNLVQKLHGWLCNRLSDLGIEVLHAIYEGDNASDAALRLGLSTQAIYNWQHKIRMMSREFLSSDKN